MLPGIRKNFFLIKVCLLISLIAIIAITSGLYLTNINQIDQNFEKVNSNNIYSDANVAIEEFSLHTIDDKGRNISIIANKAIKTKNNFIIIEDIISSFYIHDVNVNLKANKGYILLHDKTLKLNDGIKIQTIYNDQFFFKDAEVLYDKNLLYSNSPVIFDSNTVKITADRFEMQKADEIKFIGNAQVEFKKPKLSN